MTNKFSQNIQQYEQIIQMFINPRKNSKTHFELTFFNIYNPRNVIIKYLKYNCDFSNYKINKNTINM